MIGSIRESPKRLVVCERTGCSSERHWRTCISLGKQLVFAMFGRYSTTETNSMIPSERDSGSKVVNLLWNEWFMLQTFLGP